MPMYELYLWNYSTVFPLTWGLRSLFYSYRWSTRGTTSPWVSWWSAPSSSLGCWCSPSYTGGMPCMRASPWLRCLYISPSSVTWAVCWSWSPNYTGFFWWCEGPAKCSTKFTSSPNNIDRWIRSFKQPCVTG